MLLHLALTGWVALVRVVRVPGPFEYIPGSHRWPLLRGEKVRSFLTKEERTRLDDGVNHWPKYSERFVTPAIETEISRYGAPSRTFIGEKGDVLFWHGRLMHRGSIPTVPGRERRSLITHYSGIGHRPDMTERAQDENGEAYAVFNIPLH